MSRDHRWFEGTIRRWWEWLIVVLMFLLAGAGATAFLEWLGY